MAVYTERGQRYLVSRDDLVHQLARANTSRTCKRGFPTKREAQEWERTCQLQKAAADMDMSFEQLLQSFMKRISEAPGQGKHLASRRSISCKTKILPYFGKRNISEYHSTKDVIAWQNELLDYQG